MLKVSNLTVKYHFITALRTINLEVLDGECFGILGANGSGKSTFMQTVAGVLPIFQGTINFNNQDISTKSPAKRNKAGIVLVPEGRHIFSTLTVYENILMGAYLRNDSNVSKDITALFNRFERLKERKNQLAGSLSGGEQQMLAIARGLMAKPKLLLLDEPVMGLSPKMTQEIYHVIKEINQNGTTVILSVTDINAGVKLCDRCAVFTNGEVTSIKNTNELLKSSHLRRSYTGII